MSNLDNYLKHVQGEEVDESVGLAIGLGAAYLTLFGLAVWAMMEDDKKLPKHPKWKKVWDDHAKMHRQCAKHFPDSKTSFKSGGGLAGDLIGDVSYEKYEANPKRIKCQMTARLNTLKKFIKWVSRVKPEEVCKYNTKKKEKCIAYVMEIKKARINELRDLTKVLANSSEQKPLSRQQFTKINKVLGVKKKKR